MLQIIKNPSDIDTIACLYYAFKSCGRIDDIFDGHDLLWFLDQFNQRQSYLCVANGAVVGFGLINGWGSDYMRCEMSFGFLPTCGGRDAVRLGKMMMKDVFESEIRLKYGYGTTPSRNVLAVRYAKLLGMSIVATLPNYLSFHGKIDDAVMSYIERETVLGRESKDCVSEPTEGHKEEVR